MLSFLGYYNFSGQRAIVRVMFSVRRATPLQAPGGGGFMILDFDQEDTNIPPGVFDMDSDKFVAPLNGYYMFQVACSSMIDRNIHVAPFINGKQISGARDTGGYGYKQSVSGAAVTIKYLSEGSEAYVGIYRSKNNGILENGCSFSGYLLHTI